MNTTSPNRQCQNCGRPCAQDIFECPICGGTVADSVPPPSPPASSPNRLLTMLNLFLTLVLLTALGGLAFKYMQNNRSWGKSIVQKLSPQPAKTTAKPEPAKTATGKLAPVVTMGDVNKSSSKAGASTARKPFLPKPAPKRRPARPG